ncbi:alpha-N-acetylgalactosaminide alpha-2,6-sialyltransferase 6-like, partial [Saccoglossus kowalevskii]
GATGSWLSTGWFTMLLAINICDSIKVYGMVEADHCRKYPKSSIPYHYGDPKGTKECSLYNIMEAAKKNRHRFSLEKAIFARWSGLYNISFYHPEWTNPDITQEQIIHDFMSKKF